jgi:uncharacterized protein involved in exopolysaccharide biosynthesis
MTAKTDPPVTETSRMYLELTPLEFLLELWHRKTLVLGCIFCGAIAFWALSFLVPRSYRATVSILPEQTPMSLGSIGSIAAATGFSLEPEFSFEGLYREIVFSDRMLNEVLTRQWARSAIGDSISIFSALGESEHWSSELDRARANQSIKKKMRNGIIDFERDPITGFMILSVQIARYPQIAADLANYLAGRLEAYNLNSNRNKAGRKRIFVEDRLTQSTIDLARSEVEVADFLAANRAWHGSPSLILRHESMNREVEAQKGVWLELRRQLEVARIDEHAQSGIIDVLDYAVVPARSYAPSRLFALASGGALGLLCSVLAIMVRQYGRYRKNLGAGNDF